MSTEPAFTCPRCAMTSHNAHDIHEGYCGNCHDWTGAVAELLGSPDIGAAIHYDRQGQPITFARWVFLAEPRYGGDYPFLADDRLADGIRVSTIWAGIAMRHDEPPMIFETAVFLDGKLVQAQGYSTEDEAMATHTTLVRSLELVGREFLTEVSEWQTPTPLPQETRTS